MTALNRKARDAALDELVSERMAERQSAETAAAQSAEAQREHDLARQAEAERKAAILQERDAVLARLKEHTRHQVADVLEAERLSTELGEAAEPFRRWLSANISAEWRTVTDQARRFGAIRFCTTWLRPGQP